MIINTDLLKTRNCGQYIAIYGTQENPFSKNYDFMYKDEAMQTAQALLKIAEGINSEAMRLLESAEKMPCPNTNSEPRES